MQQSIKIITLALFLTPALSAFADNHDVVKVTPVGSHAGEFCSRDRALIFEDPNGTRILYDAGRTVAGPDDKRLGKIDVVLVSHVHGDHIGDKHINKVDAGSCAQPETNVSATPNSNCVFTSAAAAAPASSTASPSTKSRPKTTSPS